MISAPSASTWAMIVGDGGAAAVEMISGRSSGSRGAGVIDQGNQHRRGGAEVGDARALDEPPDVRFQLAQADVSAPMAVTAQG